MIPITRTFALDDAEVSERFVRASGPGGQNVNKVATAVELRFNVSASSLPEDAKARLLVQAAGRITADGDLLIDSREYRTQLANREAARARLVALIQHALKRPRVRRPTRPTLGSKERRLTEKKRRAETKAGRKGGDD